MTPENSYYFSQLKLAVTSAFLEHHLAPPTIEEWKGDTITDFQEDLFTKVKARVSEKWFYTYFKNTPDKLPRIDMLNLLSAYVGYQNWTDFKAAQAGVPKKEHNNSGTNPLKIGLYICIFVIPLLVWITYGMTSKNEFHFCFIDSIKNEAITNLPLDIKMLQQNESPLYFKTDSLGCFSYETKANRIQFVVQSPFHKTDTIVRTIDSKENETVKLSTDDYALMLSYYTNGNTKDWNIHKAKLQQLIHDDAQIYQMFNGSMGVEVFSKDDFIRLLTIPTTSLKRINILDKDLKDGKIIKLKFIVQ